MKHFVNLSLLFFFATLIISGLFRFLKPFDLVTTRVHIISGIGMLLLVGFHLMSRGKYFLGLLRKRRQPSNGSRHPLVLVGGVVAVWAYFLIASLYNWWPVSGIVKASYESRHQREIFRHNSRTAFQAIESGMQVKRVTDKEASIRLEMEWGADFGPKQGQGQPLGKRYPQIAIWAETEDGTILETLFVSQAAAGAETLNWDGHPQDRSDILPIWHARYKDILDQEPMAEDLDVVTSATPVRDFSMEGYLKMDAQPFSVYVEVNAPNDPNDTYHHDQPETSEGYMREGLGQPSILFEAFVFPQDNRRYFLLDLVGHSGSSSQDDGELVYGLDELTTAKQLVEKILMQVEWPDKEEPEEEDPHYE